MRAGEAAGGERSGPSLAAQPAGQRGETVDVSRCIGAP